MILPELLKNLIFMLVNGIIWAFIIALVALGLSFIYGLMEIVNVAHGELYMLGAVLTWYGLAWLGNFWLGAVVASLIVGILGIGLERGILRPVVGRPANTVIVTIGLMYILQQIVLATFGGWPRKMPDPLPVTIEFVGVRYPAYRLLVVGASAISLIALWLFLYKTSLGLWVRAAMQDREMASAMGIPVSRVYTMTFFIGAMLASLGGALAAPIVQVFFLMGLDILLLAFIVVIVGGLGSLKGTLIASLIICPLEGVLMIFVTPTEARVVSFIIMAAVLLKRPRGLFGTTRR
jgi:branched-chain amino acid transport system permease protein